LNSDSEIELSKLLLEEKRKEEDQRNNSVKLKKEIQYRIETGNLIHKAFQRFGVKENDRDLREFISREIECWDLSQDERQLFEQKIFNMLGNAKTMSLIPGEGEREYRELPVLMKIGNLFLRGKVDSVIVSKNEINVVDYKSNEIEPGQELFLAEDSGYDHQVKLYALALSQVWKDKKTRARVAFLSTANVLEYSVDSKDMDYYIGEAEKIIRSLV